MNDLQQPELTMDQRLWKIAEGLVSPDQDTRAISLNSLAGIDGFNRSPLIASILVSRISEPDIDLRYHLILLLGSLIEFDSPDEHFSEESLVFAKYALDQLDKSQLIRLLEVFDSYLTAERAITHILRLSSYAGVGLSGIVNDWKLPVSIRQGAVFYCGEVGYLSSRPTLENLIQRVERIRNRSREGSERKKNQDEEFLYPFVIAALDKLKP